MGGAGHSCGWRGPALAGRAFRETPLRCVGGGPPSARRPFAPFESLRTGFDFPQGERTPWPAPLGCWLRRNDVSGDGLALRQAQGERNCELPPRLFTASGFRPPFRP